MYKIPANTLFLGKNLIFVPECHSTNTLALELSHLPSTPDGSVIITDHQTAGRGQRGSSWEAGKGKNLTFSIILRPFFLPVKDQFFLNIFAALAIHDLLFEKSIRAKIKWPNDVLVDGKKVCGILIENQIRGVQVSNSVVGIGLNVNQHVFQSAAAGSMSAVLSEVLNLPETFERLLELLEKRYLQLKNGRLEQLRSSYLEQLYWRHETRSFQSSGISFKGAIRGIDEDGRLEVETENGLRTFGVKEISFTA